VQDELVIDPVAPDDDGVAGVVTALVAGDDVEMRGEQIDDLTFPLIAPLCADNCQIHYSSLSG
jgi:hypothetical protein